MNHAPEWLGEIVGRMARLEARVAELEQPAFKPLYDEPEGSARGLEPFNEFGVGSAGSLVAVLLFARFAHVGPISRHRALMFAAYLVAIAEAQHDADARPFRDYLAAVRST